MQTVIMSFVRGMEHGEQTLPTNDLFVHLPVQILPDLVVAMERQGFRPAQVKGSCGYRPKKEGAEDNPPLVVEVHAKGIRPGLKELTLVVPLTLRIEVPCGETWQLPDTPLQTSRLQKTTLPLMLLGQLNDRPGLRHRCQ